MILSNSTFSSNSFFFVVQFAFGRIRYLEGREMRGPLEEASEEGTVGNVFNWDARQ